MNSTFDNETLRVLANRVSVRNFNNIPVNDELIDAVLKAAFRVPTSSNIQSYSVVVVRDPETKKQLAKSVGGQQHVIHCPVFLAFCADLTRIDVACRRNGFTLDNNNLELGLVSTLDAALVGTAAYIAADSVDLKGVMIGGARNNPEEIAQLLGLPPRVFCVFGMCLGFSDASPPQKPRMRQPDVVHHERYDAAKVSAAIETYDAELATHYRDAGTTTTDDSWSHDIAAKFGPRPRDGLRAALKRMGFDFA